MVLMCCVCEREGQGALPVTTCSSTIPVTSRGRGRQCDVCVEKAVREEKLTEKLQSQSKQHSHTEVWVTLHSASHHSHHHWLQQLLLPLQSPQLPRYTLWFNFAWSSDAKVCTPNPLPNKLTCTFQGVAHPHHHHYPHLHLQAFPPIFQTYSVLKWLCLPYLV